MIFLSEQNILFIKPHKTASTSVEVALSCAPGSQADIITPLLPEDELKRAKAGGRLPQNWAWLSLSERNYLRDFATFRATGLVPKRMLPGGHGKLYSKFAARYYNHITPAAIRMRGGGEMLARTFLVSMVRHPYEQIVSWAWHQMKLQNSSGPLSDFVDLGTRQASPNLPYLFDSRRPDLVIRYEKMSDDLSRLSARVGVDLNAHMPFAKGEHRSNRAPAVSLLTEPQKIAIQKRDRQIFEEFGYDR